MPVLAYGGESGAADHPLKGMQELAANVRGGIIQEAGHWIADEQPRALADLLLDFFSGQ